MTHPKAAVFDKLQQLFTLNNDPEHIARLLCNYYSSDQLNKLAEFIESELTGY